MTMGELATVAGTQLRADVPEILPLVIDAIQDGGSQTKRLVAVSTLGQVGSGRRGGGGGAADYSSRLRPCLHTSLPRSACLPLGRGPTWSPLTHLLRLHSHVPLARWWSPPGLWWCLTWSTPSCWACCCAC